MGKFRKMKSFFIFVTFFLLEFQLSVAHNLFYCADFSCQEPISTGKTLLRYSGRSEKHLSFSKNDDIKVLSKPFGDEGEDWVAFCRGKVGLVPKNMVREMKMFKYDTKIQLPFENLPFWSTNTPKIIETADNYIDNPEDDKSQESFEQSQEGDYSEFNSSEIEPESQEQQQQQQYQQPEKIENQQLESNENESQSENNNNNSDEKPNSPPILEISPVPKTPNLETKSEAASDPVLKAQPLVEPKVVVTATHVDGNQDQVAANTNTNLDPTQVIPVDQEGTKTIEASINDPVPPVPLPAPTPQDSLENSSKESYPDPTVVSDTNIQEQSPEASSNADTKTEELAQQHPPIDPLVVSENKIEIQTDHDHPLNQETESSGSESAHQIPSSDGGESKVLKDEKIQYPKPVVVSSFPGPDSDLDLNSQSVETETAAHNNIGSESAEYLPEPPEEVDQTDKIQADSTNNANQDDNLQNSAPTETETETGTGTDLPAQENDVDSASATSIFSAVKSFSSNIINSVLPEDLQHDGTSSENENVVNTASSENPGSSSDEVSPSTETPIPTVDSVKEEELAPPPTVPELAPVAAAEDDINTDSIQGKTTPKSVADSEVLPVAPTTTNTQEPAASVPDIVNEVETSTPSPNNENENSKNEEITQQPAAEIPVSPETVVPDATKSEKIVVTSPQEQQQVPLSKLPHLEGEISGGGPPVVETPGSVFKSPSMDLDDDLINVNVLRAQLDEEEQQKSDVKPEPEPEPVPEPEQQVSPDEKLHEVDVDSNNNVIPSENSEPEPLPVDSHIHEGQAHVHEGHDHHDHEGNSHEGHDHAHGHSHSHGHHHHRHRHPQSPEDANGSSTMSIIVVVKHLSSTLLSFLPEYLQDTILDVDDALVFTGIIALTLVSICVPYFLMESFLSVRPLKKQVVELNKTLWKVSAAYENQQEEFDTYKRKALAYDEDQKRIEQLEMELQILKKLEGKQKEQVKLLQKQLKTSARAADGIEDLIETAIKEKEFAIEERNLLKSNYCRIETTLKVKCEELEEAQASGSAIALDLEVLNHEKDNLFKRSKSLEIELELLKKKLSSETEIRRVKEEEREKIGQEKDVILTELTDLKRILHQYEDNASSLTEELTTKENELLALKETLGDDSPLIDISETKAKLKSVEEEAASLKSRLDTVAYENTSLTRDIEETKKELCETKVVKEEAENQLKVLEGWFKKKEEDLRSAVSKLELEQSIKHKDKDDLVKMIREKESEVQHFFSTNDGLKQEIEDMKAAHRNELRTAEAKADEHWLSLCQSERKTADARKEAELLRQKLVALVKEKDGDDGDLLSGMGDVPLYALPLDMVPPPVPDDLSYFPLDDDFIPPLPLPLPLGSEAMRLQPLGRLSPQNTPNNNYTSYMDDDTISPIVRGNGHGGGHGHGHGHGHGDRGSISGGGGGGGGGRGDYSDDSSRSDSPLDHRRPGSRDNWINDNRNDQPTSHSQSRRRGGGGPNPNQGQRGHGGSGGSGPKTSSPIPHGVNL